MKIYYLIRFLILVIITNIVFSGCSLVTRKNFVPIKEERPVTMFDNYILKIGSAVGIEEDWCTLRCEVDFKNKVLLGSNLDVIPIFILDSICLKGECLYTNSCFVPNYGYEWVFELEKSNYITKKDTTFPVDLKWGHKEVYPMQFVFDRNIVIPTVCKDEDIQVTLHAKMYNRITGHLIAQESKKIQFLIKTKKIFGVTE